MKQSNIYQKMVFLVVAILIILAAVFVFSRKSSPDSSDSQGQTKSAHFVDSTPLHDETYAAQPINVTVNFNFDLAEGSKIAVTDSQGQEWSEGEALIEDNSTALKKSLRKGLPSGGYTVLYTACWLDKSCHEGKFTFKVDQARQSGYKDLRGQPEVMIDMKDIEFVEKSILISPGTKVTWTNQDDVIHFVNTETHPEHTYFTEHNSRQLKKGDTYATTFTTPGQYNYHCSAHASTMIASLIVIQ